MLLTKKAPNEKARIFINRILFLTVHIVALKADNAINSVISDNIFANGTTAIELDSCTGFFIVRNDFSAFDNDIVTTNTFQESAEISENIFSDADEAILMEDDDHSNLTIFCNDFYYYGAYGIKATNCTLQTQGSSGTGAGNRFYSFSSQTNHQFLHDGNSINYYCDPSDPFSLTVDNTKKVTVDTAAADGCERAHAPMLFGQNEASPIEESVADAPGIIYNVPNPSSDQTSIHFRLAKNSGPAILSIHDISGKEVGRFVVNSDQSTIEVDCSRLESGIYFNTLIQHGKRINTKKMIIVK